MPNTYTLIEKITVGAAGASSIEFTSIPQTYTDLKIVTSARTTAAAAEDFIYARYNADSGSNYTLRLLRGNGSTVASGTVTSGTYAYIGQIEGTSNTASTFTNSECYIPNYTGSTQKSYSVDTVAENNATSAYDALIAGIWTGTSAITSIVLTPATGNFTQYSTFYLYGVAKEGVNPSTSSAPYATGGDSIVFDGTYWIHTFTSSGTFTPKKGLTCDYLVVAGGAGGNIGGGGAGGLRSTVTATGGGGSLESALSLAANTGYTVTVGAGGAAATDGNNSVFSTITSNKGGSTSGPFGSGSGGAVTSGASGTTSAGASGTSGQGYAGGTSTKFGSTTPTYWGGAGGGGAGAIGSAGRSDSNPATSAGGNGGNGVATSISGSSVTYAGGGGGYNEGNTTRATGGTGGGGSADNSTNAGGSAGTANTGGGGGGRSTGGYGYAGGSGIVIVRYAA